MNNKKINEEATNSIEKLKKRIKEDSIGMYICDNILLYPNQIAIVKLTTPRCFVRFDNNAFSYFSTFENWLEKIAIIEWLDPNHKDTPTNKTDKEIVLIDIWNFLALHEAEEERLFDKRYQEEDDE